MKFATRASQLAAFATGALGWRPADFWDSTPSELASALGRGEPDREQISGAEIERLRELFPDEQG